MKTRLSLLAIALASVSVFGTGCATLFKRPTGLESPPVVKPTIKHQSLTTEGSLWAGSDSWSLIADDKAGRAGDLLLVRVLEEASAEKKTGTQIDRGSEIDAGIQNLLGFEQRFGNGRRVPRDPDTGELLGWRQDINLDHLVRQSNESKFDAEATVEQSGKILANVMTEVIERKPNGNLRVWGSQVISINNEDQVITIEGVVRPTDIGYDNSVPSTRLASAKIVFSGRGPSSQATRPGLFQRLYYAVWPF